MHFEANELVLHHHAAWGPLVAEPYYANIFFHQDRIARLMPVYFYTTDCIASRDGKIILDYLYIEGKKHKVYEEQLSPLTDGIATSLQGAVRPNVQVWIEPNEIETPQLVH